MRYNGIDFFSNSSVPSETPTSMYESCQHPLNLLKGSRLRSEVTPYIKRPTLQKAISCAEDADDDDDKDENDDDDNDDAVAPAFLYKFKAEERR